MDKLQLMLEADRRGILPPEKKAVLDEAIKRGLVSSGVSAPPDAIDASAQAAMRPTRLERLGRGFADVTQGIKQAALTVMDKLTAPTLEDLVSGNRAGERYTREKTEELARYEKGRGPDAGMDLMRLGGNIVATAPVSMLPGAGAATMGLRTAATAAQGAAASGVMFTPEGESKLTQTLVGAGLGAAVPVAVQGVRQAVSNLIPKAATVTPQALQGEITLQLQQKGIDFNKLSAAVQASLLADAQNTLRGGKTLDAAQMARKVDIEAVGGTPTRASITRNPRDWQTEKNLRGVQGVGDDIVARDQANAAALVDELSRMRTATGGKARSAVEAGESAVGAIRAQDAAKKKVVDDLYTAYRSAGAQDAPVPATRVADTLGRVADEIGVENIPPAVLNRLKEFGLMGGRQTKLLTVNEADKLNKLINNNNPGAGTPGARALQPIKEAINEALLDIPEKGASEALLKARGAAAQRFAEQRAGKGIEAAIDDVAPDRFVKRFVTDADVRDVRAMVKELKKSPQGAQAIADVKGHLFDNLLMKATGATNVDDVAGRAFSGVRLSKALDEIGPEKLHQLFSPSEVEALRTLQRASKYLTEEVPFSDVNHSKTVAALSNLLLKIGQTPMLGQIVSPIIGTARIGMDWVKSAADRKAVAEALVGSAAGGKAATVPLTPPGNLTRLAPAGAAGLAQPYSDDRN